MCITWIWSNWNIYCCGIYSSIIDCEYWFWIIDLCVRVIVDGVIFKNELKTRPDDLKEDLKNTGNLVIGKVNTKPEHIDELFSDDDN